MRVYITKHALSKGIIEAEVEQVAPASGPVFGEHCNAIDKVVEGGITCYVLEGYGDEPFEAAWFVEIVEVRVMKEMELAEI